MDEYLDQFMEDHLGNILDELNSLEPDEYPDLDEPWDDTLAKQELEDFEQADEYFGYYDGSED